MNKDMYAKCERSIPALTISTVELPTTSADMDQGEAYNPPNKSTIIPTFAAAVSDIQKYSKKRDEPESLVKENQLAATNWNQLE